MISRKTGFKLGIKEWRRDVQCKWLEWKMV